MGDFTYGQPPKPGLAINDGSVSTPSGTLQWSDSEFGLSEEISRGYTELNMRALMSITQPMPMEMWIRATLEQESLKTQGLCCGGEGGT